MTKKEEVWLSPIKCKHCGKLLTYRISRTATWRYRGSINFENVTCVQCYRKGVEKEEKRCHVKDCRNLPKHSVEVSSLCGLAMEKHWYCEDHEFFIDVEKSLDEEMKRIPEYIKQLRELGLLPKKR